ncbi:MAG: DUF4249 family protein [Cyclobacteriaceae bacterium]
MIVLKERFLPLFLLFLSVSCIREEVIDDFNAQQDTKPVVFCTLSPEDSIQLLLYHSSSMFDGPSTIEDKGIYDAQVRIYNEHGDTILLQNPEEQVPLYKIHQRAFPIVAGETYHLEIQLSNSTNRITSSTTVPKEAVPWDSFEVHNKRFIYEELKEFIVDRFVIRDTIRITLVDVKGSWSNQSYYNTKIISSAYRYSDLSYVRTTTCCHYLWVTDIRIESHYNEKGQSINHKIPQTFSIVTLNQDLADYYQAYEVNHANKESLDFGLFLRLFKGVLPEFTNIQGGLGVFGAYLSDTKEI